MALENPSKSLVIIGNGLDLMHGVKSSYDHRKKQLIAILHGDIS